MGGSRGMAGGDTRQGLTGDLAAPKFQPWALDRTVWGHPWVPGTAQSLGTQKGQNTEPFCGLKSHQASAFCLSSRIWSLPTSVRIPSHVD